MTRNLTQYPAYLTWRGGFTLVEILTVVVILGIASALIIPQLGDRGDLRAAAGARVVMADLLYAQNRAIATQKTHWVKFDVDEQSYGLYDDLGLTTRLTHPVQKVSYLTRFNGRGELAIPDVTLMEVDFSGQVVIGFDALGQPLVLVDGNPVELSADGKIELQSGQARMRLIVAPFTGEINVVAVQ